MSVILIACRESISRGIFFVGPLIEGSNEGSNCIAHVPRQDSLKDFKKQ